MSAVLAPSVLPEKLITNKNVNNRIVKLSNSRNAAKFRVFNVLKRISFLGLALALAHVQVRRLLQLSL